MTTPTTTPIISMVSMLQRVKAIPNNFIKRLDLFTYEVKSSNPKNLNEVKYMVFYSLKYRAWSCSCPDYMYRNNPETPDYQCKHIIRVTNMIILSYKRQMKKAKRDLGIITN